MQSSYVKSRSAAGAIAPYSIAAFTANRNEVVQSTGALCELAGVTDAYGASGGGMVDLHVLGEAEVRAGCQIAEGDPLTSDNQGRVVPFSGPVGAEACILGHAAHAAEEHELCRVVLLPPWAEEASGPVSERGDV